jgi:hypothetical protein
MAQLIGEEKRSENAGRLFRRPPRRRGVGRVHRADQ